MQGTAQTRKTRGGRPKSTGSRRYGCRTAKRRRTRTVRLPEIDATQPVLGETATLPLEGSTDCGLLRDEVTAIQGITLPALERRLQKRYLIMLQSHMRSAPDLAAGVASLPSSGSAFAATQAAWRFLNNDRVPLSALVEPMRVVGRIASQRPRCRSGCSFMTGPS